MAVYTVKLKGKEEIAKETMAFRFEKPNDFKFKAGQFSRFTLIDPPENDDEGNSRTFTLTSAPFEKDLIVATRMRSTAFKRSLKKIPIGIELKLEGPTGSFVLHSKVDIPAVFLTGGIGITPVRSILQQATHDKLAHEIFLFYSNHTPQDAAFMNEFKELAQKNSHFHFIPVMSKAEKGTWNGESGHIDLKMLSRYLSDIKKPIYYISGPNDMVSAMEEMLHKAGISDDNVRSEVFGGY